MADLYSNENFDKRIVLELRRLGHDVLTSFEAGRANQRIDDADVLQFATQENRAVLTYNRRDFIRLHNSNPQHAGIIVCTDDRDVLALAARIHTELIRHTSLKAQLIRICKPNINSTRPSQ
ncbi:MAG: DUF5615 family PIN-like protein [Verrucomicrobiales bacterium]|nr:DUF5615 family PIN-like protein [Verrucomicrobiales bacterium]